MIPAGTIKKAAAINVLLIEDDPDDRRLVDDYLSEAGRCLFSLESADRLSVGLERLSEGDIGAVLLDLFLPDSEGFQTFVQTHSRSPRVTCSLGPQAPCSAGNSLLQAARLHWDKERAPWCLSTLFPVPPAPVIPSQVV
jgi:CheY-like chemotaxis protein